MSVVAIPALLHSLGGSPSVICRFAGCFAQLLSSFLQLGFDALSGLRGLLTHLFVALPLILTLVRIATDRTSQQNQAAQTRNFRRSKYHNSLPSSTSPRIGIPSLFYLNYDAIKRLI